MEPWLYWVHAGSFDVWLNDRPVSQKTVAAWEEYPIDAQGILCRKLPSYVKTASGNIFSPEYEKFLEEYGMTNGEINIIYGFIKESYRGSLENHAFMEEGHTWHCPN